jgi:hypothetical protein
VVRTGDTEVVAHRLVLAACSEYFRACLTGVGRPPSRYGCMASVCVRHHFAWCALIVAIDNTHSLWCIASVCAATSLGVHR